MALATAIFVSKRLQRVAFAFLCLVAAHLVLAVASCEPDEFAPIGARVQTQPQAAR